MTQTDWTAAVGSIREEGTYQVVVTAAEKRISKSNTPGIVLTFRTTGGLEIQHTYWMAQEKSLLGLMNSLQWTDEMKREGLKKKNLIGRRCKIEVDMLRNPTTNKRYYEVADTRVDTNWHPEDPESPVADKPLDESFK